MGLYSSLEDKWYDLLDKLDSKLPVYKVIDPIDNIFPSFILFLLIVFLILLFVFFNFFVAGSIQNNFEVVVLSNANLPLQNVEIFVDDVNPFKVYTDDEGKVNFKTQSGEVKVNLKKENFSSLSEIVYADKKNIIKLDPKSVFLSEEKYFTAVVQDSSKNILTTAKLDIVCDGKKETLSGQTETGFNFQMPSCALLQLTASNYGYKSQTYTIKQEEERKIFNLEREITKAKVIFTTKTTTEIRTQVEILIKDEFGKTVAILESNSFGEADYELEIGKYDYTANSNGEIQQGEIIIENTDLKNIVIIFQKNLDAALDEKIKELAFEITDLNQQAISGAQIIVFRDSNKLFERTTAFNGKTTPYKINIETSIGSFFAIIKASGYQTKLVVANLQNRGNYQKIELEQGSSSLRVRVVNEEGVGEKDASVFLYIDELLDPISNGLTDSNGWIVFSNFPNRTYKIFAINKTRISEAEENITMVNNYAEKEIVLVTGTGKMVFNFYDGIKKVVPKIKMYVDNNGIFVESNQFTISTNSIQTATFKVGTKIKILVNDENYVQQETFEYIIKRGTENRTIKLRRVDDLPNNNLLQMFLNAIYSSNPITTNASEITKIMPNNIYYAHFSLVINNDNNNNPTTNFYLTGINETWFTDAITTGNYQRLMNNNIENFYISDENNIDEKAKHINIIHSEKNGVQEIPIIVTMTIDQNAIGKFKIHYQTKNNGVENQESLLYEKEFSIGETFCINNCPTFAFDNFIIDGEKIIPVLDEGVELFLENEYKLKTKIQNLSQEDFEQIMLKTSIAEQYLGVIGFENNVTTTSQSFDLSPFSFFESTQKNLELKKVGTAYVKNQVEKISSGIDDLKDYTGTIKEIRVKIKLKQQLNVEVYPSTIYSGAVYPTFIVKTTYGNNIGISSNWSIMKLVGDEEFDIGGYRGKTDGNGMEIIQFDASSLNNGDKIIIYAENEESLPVQKIINVVYPIEDELLLEPDCLTFSYNNFPLTQPINITLNVDSSANISVISNCSEEKKIDLISKLLLSSLNLTIKPDETKNISITAKKVDGVLGVFPVTIKEKQKTLALIDVVVTESGNCFSLEKAVFDFTNTQTISSKIVNKCFDGRKDNFYPKMNINTNSVSLTYNKPGNPEEMTLNIGVFGGALEMIVYGFGWGTIIAQKNKGKDCNPSAIMVPPEKLDLVETGQEMFTEFVESIASTEVGPRPVTEFVKGGLNTIGKLFFKESVEKIAEKISLAESILLSEKKEDKISFGENAAGRGPILDSEFAVDDIINYYPDRIGDILAEPEPCELKHTMPWMAAPRPPGYEEADWFVEGWKGVMEKPYGDLIVKAEENCNPCKITAFALNYEGPGIDGILYTRGEEPSTWDTISGTVVGATVGVVTGAATGAAISTIPTIGIGTIPAAIVGGIVGGLAGGVYGFFDNIGEDTALLSVQPEFYRAIAFGKEQQALWSKEQKIIPEEGKVYDLGSYLEATPVPEWENVKDAFGHAVGETWTTDTITQTLIGVTPLGFVPRELADSMKRTNSKGELEEGPANFPSSSDPTVEANASGLIHYMILPWDVGGATAPPEGIKAYLKDGHLWAEYIGTPEVSGPNITFSLTKNNLIGTEYVVITVSDWTSGSATKTQQFQVKLIGPSTTCLSSGGVEGGTGKEFVPNIKFNWDWQQTTINACDQTNNNYHYCDATQFTISLFKKLQDIENTLQANRLHLTPEKTVFYSYLIKDNYTNNFLNDFDTYYSSAFANAETYFTGKFNKFIKENKIELINTKSNNNYLPYGGLYRVEIDLGNISSATNSLFENDSPRGKIIVRLTPIQKAPNYNQFYETPFDGMVGSTNNNFERKDYGVSLQGDSIKLNELIYSNTFDEAAKLINVQKVSDLVQLDKGIVLNFTEDNLVVSHSQPNPIIMEIDSTKTGKLEVKYALENSSQNLNKIWALVGSTLGSDKCLDLSGNDKQLFVESSPGVLTWGNAKVGKNWLATTFFTPPKGESSPIMIKPLSQQIKLHSAVPLNYTSAVLDYYDQIGITDYDTLQGIFDKVANEEMCISKNNENEVNIWWNPEYLTELIKEMGVSTSHDCVGDSIISTSPSTSINNPENISQDEKINPNNPVIEPTAPSSNNNFGVGHALAISLKDEYRSQIIPLVAESGAKYTPIYLTRDPMVTNQTGEDGSFMNLNISPFNNFDASDGFNGTWWNRFASYLAQCKQYEITPIVSLYDFCCSGGEPFGWFKNFDNIDKEYVSRVVDYLDESGVDYIINIGVERVPKETPQNLTADFVNDAIKYLTQTKKVPLSKIALSDEVRTDLGSKITTKPYYTTDHGNYIPNGANTINDEEKMSGGGYPSSCNGSTGSGWGGSGTTQQYINYLNSIKNNGIAALNFWHLKAFNDCKDAKGGEDMRKIFAPNQIAAIKQVLNKN